MNHSYSLPRAVAMAHHLLRGVVRPGDPVVDATCGNGHDTVALAGMTGPGGMVLALDIQPDAVAATMDLCLSHGVGDRVRVVCGGHEDLAAYWQRHMPDQAGAVAIVFNLGYLPGGDKSLITRTDTTLAALAAALGILAAGGMLVIVCYPGHDGGCEETAAVLAWASTLPADGFLVSSYGFLNQPARPPQVIAVQRRPAMA